MNESYDHISSSAQITLINANLAFAPGEAVNSPLSYANVWHYRLLNSRTHGNKGLDWAVITLKQARKNATKCITILPRA